MVENHFFRAINPVTTLGKLVGILPMSHVENNRIVFSKYTLIHNMALLLFSMWLTIKMGFLVFQRDIVGAITDMTVLALNELQLIIAYGKTVVDKKSFLGLAYTILKTDKLFAELGVQLPDRKLRGRTYKCIAIQATFIIIGFVLQIHFKLLSTYIQWMYSYTLLTTNSVLNCCAALFVSRVRDGFKTLNYLIKQRVDANEDFAVPLTDFLTSASIIHQNLTKSIKKFNECFGITLLATITAAFLITVVSLYAGYVSLKHDDDVILVANYLIFCVFIIGNTSFLCHLCEVTIENGRKSVALVHRIRSTDYEVKNEIEMFSLQVAHELDDFTAAKVFPINHSLIISMASGVSTLLIIIIQLSPE